MQRMENAGGMVAVVTGGASGIGKATASALANRGARVVIADIERAALESAASEIDAEGIVTDVASLASMTALAAEVQRRHGAVDVFISNAGVGSTARIAEMTPADWDWLLGVNVRGFVNGIRAFLPLLRANPRGGYLVVTASEAGFRVTPGLGGYTASKFAVIAIAETLAAELKAEEADVGLTILCPGPISTRLGSSQRNRDDAGEGHLLDSDLEHTREGRELRWMDPKDVADILIRAMRQGDLYAFTHPEMLPLVEERHNGIELAIRRSRAF